VKDVGLHELEIERGSVRLKIVNQKSSPCATGEHAQSHAAAAQTQTIIRGDKMPQLVDSENDAKYHTIKSPIVGTFYSAPSPEAPDFVGEGVPIDVNSTVCIIEAMKIMNEIQAEVKGIVSEVFVRNGQAVEFGQPLFRIRKL
jgi:acetyl-CoA carboxylase biotin carboxyl carrier protein